MPRARQTQSASSVTLPLMASKRGFEEQIAALDELRQGPEEVRVKALHKALAHRNNFIVAKAADLVRDFRMADLVPDLLLAFDRFFENPVKTDPQCWAKNALSRALAALEYQEPESFSARDAAHPNGTGLGRALRHCGNSARHLCAGAGTVPQF